MPDLDTVLATIREKITRYGGQGIGEQDTKATLIVPVLRALGWDVEDLEDVRLEYKRKPSDNPVDYALVLLREPRLFIEAKALGAHLDDPKWTGQILGYAVAAGVEWVALTDGNAYHLYNSHATVPVEQKLFRTVQVADPASRPAETLALLSKAQLGDHLIDQYWKSEFVDRQLGGALRALFAAEPDPAVVRLLHGRLPSLSRADVRASLSRLRANFDFPVVAPPAPRLRRADVTRTDVAHPATAAQPASKGVGTPWRTVTLAQLIESGWLRVPLEISHRSRGRELRARIEAADRIVLAGVAYDSLSIAGGMARKAMGADTLSRAYPPTNGRTFWECSASNGAHKQLDALRREFHEGKLASLSATRRSG